MAKESSSKIIWIIVAVILGVLIGGGLIFGFGFYYLYKVGTTQPSPSATIAKTRDLSIYSNARYGFSFNYPKTFITTESQNNDGVTLTAENPTITIRAYGSNNALSQTLDEYLNFSRENLYQESEDQENAKEILAEDLAVGAQALGAKERQWETVPAITGILTITDQVSYLKDDIFYTLQMEVAKSDYDEYTAHVFDDILASFKLKQGGEVIYD